MITIIQRVTAANVSVGGEVIGAIERGIMALVAVEPGDDEKNAARLLERVLNYRIFPDAEGRMNLALTDIGGGLLLVPQFTLAADTRKGNRPSFSGAATPEHGQRLFAYLAERAKCSYRTVECGRFGADMQVFLINDGPVTFTLRTSPVS
jgi:D-tyrosyl-tRNA(Tyr) deacylase